MVKFQQELEKSQEDDIKWFMEAINQTDKRIFVFGNVSLNKLVEFGSVKNWIVWLKEHFQHEEKELNEIAERELQNRRSQSRLILFLSGK